MAMSMLDAFFSKGSQGGVFKAAKCKTLLKLTIPRIKLLRNRRELQLKQMRREIAKLLETGQEATARIRVEHIIREENMNAAQEILELFCELIVVRLPIIETQRECPIDLKEAISSICFAAPRCADLPELLQVQMQFVTKYGKEFVAASSELMPDCGVNRQLIELLSIRAPSVEAKVKLLKEIAEEHELDWDPSATETEFLKPHEDLLNGPNYFNGSTLPLPEEKYNEALVSNALDKSHEEPQSDAEFDSLDLPEVPKASVQPTPDVPSAPDIGSHLHHSRPVDGDLTHGFSSSTTHLEKNVTADASFKTETLNPDHSFPYVQSDVARERRQFIPFVSPPPFPSTSVDEREELPLPPLLSSVKSAEPEILSKNTERVVVSSMKPAEREIVSEKTEQVVVSSVKPAEPEFLSQKTEQVVSSSLKPSEPEIFFERTEKVAPPQVPPSGSILRAPVLPSASLPSKQTTQASSMSRTQSGATVDLQDVLSAAQTAAETAERAASAARAAADLAHLRISDLVTKQNTKVSDSCDDEIRNETYYQDHVVDKPVFDHQDSFSNEKHEHEPSHTPQRLTSLEDDPYFSYPNLFSSKVSDSGSGFYSNGAS